MPKLVLTTLSNMAQANKFAKKLVEEKLAACVSLSRIDASYYLWEGTLEKSAEVQLFIKTSQTKLPSLRTFFKKNHPYTLPEFVVLNASASREYGAWMRSTMKKI